MSPKMHPVKFYSVNAARQQNFESFLKFVFILKAR
jgi:hypothetical protein